MGINGLWDVIGRGELITLAKLATDHFNQHGRPLRVAVDEPGWRFNNLTPHQVEFIRSKEPAANPIEKNIMWRILHLMKYNIQLIWVFDGPKRPWKRNKRGGGGRPQDERERTQLTCQLLDHLKVPYHRAPAEAEAECARMQQLGIVDAVWSDDGDTLMFGATCMISAHKEGKSWSTDEIRIVHAATILAEHDLDRSSMVLFAMLAGGDYNTAGLPNCGPQIARRVARKETGLADALCRASDHDLPAWRLRLEDELRKAGKRLPVPVTFPDEKALGLYHTPVITPDDGLRNLTCLKNGWDLQIDQSKLRVLLRHRFNVWTKGYMKHVAPVLMIRQLSRCLPSDDAKIGNLKYDIQLKKTRQKKAGVGEDSAQPTELEKKVTFYPLPAVDIDIREPEGEDWSIWEKDGSHYDPASRVECIVMSCFLTHGLPEGFLVAPEPPKRLRKQNAGAAAIDQGLGDFAQAAPLRTTAGNTAVADSAPKPRCRPKKTSGPTSTDPDKIDALPKKRGRPPKSDNAPSTKHSPKRRKGSPELECPPKPPLPVFRQSREFNFARPAVSPQNTQASQQDTATPPNWAAPSSSGPIDTPSALQALSQYTPGENIPPATLRELRAVRWGAASSPLSPSTNPNTTAQAVSAKVPPGAVVIDLTD